MVKKDRCSDVLNLVENKPKTEREICEELNLDPNNKKNIGHVSACLIWATKRKEIKKEVINRLKHWFK